MAEEEKRQDDIPAEAISQEEAAPTGPQNRKEELYEHLRGKISVKALDIIIVGLFVALAVVVVIGMIK